MGIRLQEDSVLIRTVLRYDRVGDHVDEVRTVSLSVVRNGAASLLGCPRLP